MSVMRAVNLKTLEEFILGAEDRVFRSDAGWFWQARGYADAYGPFSSRELATADYDECQTPLVIEE